MNGAMSASGSDHHWLNPSDWSSPSSAATAGLCKSPSISSTLEDVRCASVMARLPAVNVLPSLVAPLVTCTDFSSRSLRRLSSRVARARNFSAPRLMGSVSATGRAAGDRSRLAARFAVGSSSCAIPLLNSFGERCSSGVASVVSGTVTADCRFSISDLRKASCIRLTLLSLLSGLAGLFARSSARNINYSQNASPYPSALQKGIEVAGHHQHNHGCRCANLQKSTLPPPTLFPRPAQFRNAHQYSRRNEALEILFVPHTHIAKLQYDG